MLLQSSHISPSPMNLVASISNTYLIIRGLDLTWNLLTKVRYFRHLAVYGVRVYVHVHVHIPLSYLYVVSRLHLPLTR